MIELTMRVVEKEEVSKEMRWGSGCWGRVTGKMTAEDKRESRGSRVYWTWPVGDRRSDK